MVDIWAKGSIWRSQLIDPSAGDVIKNFDLLYIGISGDIVVEPVKNNGVTVLYSNVPVGWFPVAVIRVLQVGTTADNIVGNNIELKEP